MLDFIRMALIYGCLSPWPPVLRGGACWPAVPLGCRGGTPPVAGAPHARPPWTPRQHLPLLPPAPSFQLMATYTSRLHVSPDMKAPCFGGEAAVIGAKLCVSSFGDVIYYHSLGTGLRPSTHFSWATPAPSRSAGSPSAGRPPHPLLTQQFGSLDFFFFLMKNFHAKERNQAFNTE